MANCWALLLLPGTQLTRSPQHRAGRGENGRSHQGEGRQDPGVEHDVASLGLGPAQPQPLTGAFSYSFSTLFCSLPFLSFFSLVFALKAWPRKAAFPRSITLPPTFSCYLHQRSQAHTFETKCHLKDYRLKKKKKISNCSKKKQVMENLTFILVLLDHTYQEESRDFKGIRVPRESRPVKGYLLFHWLIQW